MGAKNIIAKAGSLSFLLVLIVGLLFLYVSSFTESSIFPQNADGWNSQLQARLLMFTVALVAASIFARKELRALASATYWKAQGAFLGSALVSGVFLILIKGLVKGAGSIDIIASLSYMSFATIVVYCYVTAQVEELLFGGVFYPALAKNPRIGKRVANIIVAFVFAIFHYASSGGNWVVIATYVPIRLAFNYVRDNGYPGLRRISPRFFGATPYTQQSNAGAHFSFNAFVLGFIKPFQV